MKKITSLTLILTSILTTSFIQQHGYRIVGSAIGLADSSVIFLEYHESVNNKRVDSAYVIKEKFSFSGEIKPKIVNALIRTRDYKNYKFLWLENATISFKAENRKFRNAHITGSKTQDEQNELDSSLMAFTEEEKRDKYLAYVNNHTNSIISAHLLNVYASTWGVGITTSLYEGLSSEMRSTSYGKNVLEFISLNEDLKIGDKYVDFSQEDTHQRIVKLSDFNGKVVLLEFWGSWCGPCRRTNPELVNIYNEFKGKGFEILGVGAEKSKEDWLKAIEEDKLCWTNVTDLKGDKNKAALIYGVSYYPTNFLIDKTGTIVSRDLKDDALREKLNEILTTD